METLRWQQCRSAKIVFYIEFILHDLRIILVTFRFHHFLFSNKIIFKINTAGVLFPAVYSVTVHHVNTSVS